jgi:MSHA pilin protein MshD
MYMLADTISPKQYSKGFTLIELVIGIVLFSIAMVTIVSVIMPQTKQAIDPLWQVRALTLGQSLLSEISSKAFDENSTITSGRQACNFTSSCTLSGNLGADTGESRNNFDDIDDYDGLNLTGLEISNASESSLSADVSDLFLGFQAQISVVYDDNTDGINDDDLDNDSNLDTGTVAGNKKLITVIVITPGGEEIPFSSYRTNV